MSAFNDLLDKMLAEKAAEDAKAFESPCSEEKAKSECASLKAIYKGKPLYRSGGNFFDAGNRNRSCIIRPDVMAGMINAGLVALSASKGKVIFL